MNTKRLEISSQVQLNDSTPLNTNSGANFPEITILSPNSVQMEVDIIEISDEDSADRLPESSKFKRLPVNNKRIEKKRPHIVCAPNASFIDNLIFLLIIFCFLSALGRKRVRGILFKKLPPP